MKKRLVVLETPYKGNGYDDLEKNMRYARACMQDSLKRGEAPFASHLLYTQEGILRDTVPEERRMGIEAGFAWRDCAEATIVYVDLGISDGMRDGIQDAEEKGRTIERRVLPAVKWENN